MWHVYPCQRLFHCDHLLFHHHHQLDPFFIAHGDLAGHIANVLSCRVRGDQWEQGLLESETDRGGVMRGGNGRICFYYLLTFALWALSVTSGSSARRICFSSCCPTFLCEKKAVRTCKQINVRTNTLQCLNVMLFIKRQWIHCTFII